MSCEYNQDLINMGMVHGLYSGLGIATKSQWRYISKHTGKLHTGYLLLLVEHRVNEMQPWVATLYIYGLPQYNSDRCMDIQVDGDSYETMMKHIHMVLHRQLENCFDGKYDMYLKLKKEFEDEN